jgi:hypothetical protein
LTDLACRIAVADLVLSDVASALGLASREDSWSRYSIAALAQFGDTVQTLTDAEAGATSLSTCCATAI